MTPTDEVRIEEAARAMHGEMSRQNIMDYLDTSFDLEALATAALAPTLAELADMTAKVERLEAENAHMKVGRAFTE